MIGNKPFSRATADELEGAFLDAYNGTRAALVDDTKTGFHVEKSENKNIGFSVFQNDDVGNAAQANITIKGPGPLYTNNSGISHYGAGYYIAWLKSSGLIYSDSMLNIVNWNNNNIIFRTGNTFSGVTEKLTIFANGVVRLHVAPAIFNPGKVLGLNEFGDLIEIEKTSLIPATLNISELVIIGVNGVDGNPTAPASPLRVTGGKGSNTILLTGVVVAGAAAEIKIEGGDGGDAVTSVDTNIAGKGGDFYALGGDGGIAAGGTSNIDGNGGNASLQGGETRNGIPGFAAVKAGNASGIGVEGGSVYIVPGFGDGLTDTDVSLFNGTIFLNLSPNLTSVRGNTVIGFTVDDRVNRLQVNGKVRISSSIQIGNNTDAASGDNLGAVRYKEIDGKSYIEFAKLTNTGHAWESLNEPIKNQIKNGYEYFNDFEGIIAANYNDTHYFFAVNNLGALLVTSEIAYNANDVLRFSTAGSTNAISMMYSQSSSIANATNTLIMSARASALSDGTDNFYAVFGRSSSASTFTTGIYFVYDRYDTLANGFTNDNWIAVCRVGGSLTAIDTGIAVDVNNYQKLQIDIINLTTVNFYIDNTLATSITTNIPSSDMVSVARLSKTLGTNNINFNLDYVYNALSKNTTRI